MKIDLSSGAGRAGLVFVIVFGMLLGVLWLLDRSFGINFYGEMLLVLIGAGWASYWVYKKTEHGRY